MVAQRSLHVLWRQVRILSDNLLNRVAVLVKSPDRGPLECECQRLSKNYGLSHVP